MKIDEKDMILVNKKEQGIVLFVSGDWMLPLRLGKTEKIGSLLLQEIVKKCRCIESVWGVGRVSR